MAHARLLKLKMEKENNEIYLDDRIYDSNPFGRL